jgi:Zn-dependent protease with chaperone function
VSRQREFLADARAVQFTRSKDGLGGVLRKVAGQQAQRAYGASRSLHPAVQHMLLVDALDRRYPLVCQPSAALSERIRPASTAGRWRRSPRIGMMKCRRGPTPSFKSHCCCQ